MAIDYLTLNNNITKAIENQLLCADIVPPNARVTELAGDISTEVLTELQDLGLTKEVMEGFWNSGAKAKAFGTN